MLGEFTFLEKVLLLNYIA